MHNDMTFGDLINCSREAAGYSSAEKAAPIVGIHHNTMYKYEANQLFPPAETVLRMAICFGTPHLFIKYLDIIFAQQNVNLGFEFDFTSTNASTMTLKTIKELNEAVSQTNRFITIMADGIVEDNEREEFEETVKEFLDLMGPLCYWSIYRAIKGKTADSSLHELAVAG